METKRKYLCTWFPKKAHVDKTFFFFFYEDKQESARKGWGLGIKVILSVMNVTNIFIQVVS